MEQTALRPKPMPGREPGAARAAPGRRPHAARRRGRRLRTLLFSLLACALLMLCGAVLGGVGSTVAGLGPLTELQRRADTGTGSGADSGAGGGAARSAPAPGPVPPAPPAALGVEAVDAEKAGALVVGVHVPGPGHYAGLVHGDVLLTFDGTRVDTAADLVRAVAAADPGRPVTITVRHDSGGYQQLSITPAVVV
ncbi:PDZ domain-containing protein [Streptomyces sp. NPDC048290]|uniref:PDZ domain-containing protein n=1 Tax=Streptomyces sp. NPDC048290 TaxID=3155811 RepID=UPI003432FBB9